MKAVVITNKGLETYSEKEINKLGYKTQTKERLIFFEAEKEDIIKIAYDGRTFQRVLFLMDEYVFEKKPQEQFDAKKIKEIKESFTIDGERYGEHEFNSFDLRKQLGFFINQTTKKKYDIKNGLTKFYFFINEKYFLFGIDISGFDLSKRDYRIFLSPESLKPNIAASMLLEADYSSEKILLDPFSRSGELSVEAALIALNKSPNYHSKKKFSENIDFKDKLKDIKTNINCFDNEFKHIIASKKNAKIAGVNKYINFSRQDLKNLDLKFENESIDCIVTQTPKFSKRKDPNDLLELYKNFFEQVKLLLKKDGIAVLLVNNLKVKELTKLKLTSEQKIELGESTCWILKYKKN